MGYRGVILLSVAGAILSTFVALLRENQTVSFNFIGRREAMKMAG
jgi:hypothetical protein